MLDLFRRFKLPVALASGAALTLTGCGNMNPAVLAGLPGDILNGASTIRDIGRNPHDLGNISRMVTLIATVHKYAVLTAAQRQHVEVVVENHYQGMVAKEKKSLKPRYENKKAEVRKRATVKSAAVRQKDPSAAAKVDAEAEKEVQQVDLEWEKAAKSEVAKNYGTDFAVPVTSAEGKPVVAFATVKDSGVSVSDNSYIADQSGTLAKGSKVSHGGKTYAVLE